MPGRKDRARGGYFDPKRWIPSVCVWDCLRHVNKRQGPCRECVGWGWYDSWGPGMLGKKDRAGGRFWQEGLGISICHTRWGGGGVPTAYQNFWRSKILMVIRKLCDRFEAQRMPKRWKNTWEYHNGGVSKRVNWIPHLAAVSWLIRSFCTILPFVDILVLLSAVIVCVRNESERWFSTSS